MDAGENQYAEDGTCTYDASYWSDRQCSWDILERINIDIYNKLLLKDPQILWQLYEPFNITWKLTGTIQEVVRINYNIVQLASKTKNLPRFEEYLKLDYIKYRK